MKSNNLFLLFILPLAFAYGCCIDNNKCIDFTPDELLWMPYGENDTLIFKNFQNDSIYSFHILSYKEEGIPYNNGDMFSCNTGCMNIIKVHFLTIQGVPFSFDYFIEKTHIKGLVDSFYVEAGISYAYGVLNSTIKNGSYFELKSAKHIDSIIVANKIIYDVFEFTSPYNSNRIKRMWIKKGKGILKFIYNDKQIFELIKY